MCDHKDVKFVIDSELMTEKWTIAQQTSIPICYNLWTKDSRVWYGTIAYHSIAHQNTATTTDRE